MILHDKCHYYFRFSEQEHPSVLLCVAVTYFQHACTSLSILYITELCLGKDSEWRYVQYVYSVRNVH